ncbi:MAG: DUF2799 domain-containing protein [Gammaproteobacteria bacterium]|nr:DUF2799 domain-containing protein [Gammaproteobacteria bacterium]MDH3537239.1 DUF2799 domain-containing protein [Gammaproteobacteria bacterium]
MKIKRLVYNALVLLLVAGCATMDKSECREADWQIIGLEDGARGRLVSYIGNHREACAEHGVTPDLASYERGHANGIRQFCTDSNGFRQGRAGRSYNGVCPAGLQGRFLAAYETGRELYQLSFEINRLQRDVSGMQDELAALTEQHQGVETMLVSAALSVKDRKTLLDRFKQLQSQIAGLEIDIRDFELEAARRQGEYDVLNAAHGY